MAGTEAAAVYAAYQLGVGALDVAAGAALGAMAGGTAQFVGQFVPRKRQKMSSTMELDQGMGIQAGGAHLGDYSIGRHVVWKPGSWYSKKRKLGKRAYGKFIAMWGRLSEVAQPITSANISGLSTAPPSWGVVRAFQLKNEVKLISPPPANYVGSRELPVHIFDLCQKHALAANTGTPTASDRGFGYFLRDDGSDITWGNLTGKRVVASTARDQQVPWLYYSDRGEADDLHNLPTTVLDKVVVDLTLQGLRNNPCTYYVKLVQFKSAGLEPHAPSNDTRLDFWRRFTRRLISHPDARTAKHIKELGFNDMKVLKSWQYYFAPSTTIESMTTPSIRREKLVINLNRRCDWTGTAEAVPDIGIDGIDEENETGVYQSKDEITGRNYLYDVRARVYLLVYCTNHIETRLEYNQTAVFNPDANSVTVAGVSAPSNYTTNVPQYDARFYMHHTYVSGDVK